MKTCILIRKLCHFAAVPKAILFNSTIYLDLMNCNFKFVFDISLVNILSAEVDQPDVGNTNDELNNRVPYKPFKICLDPVTSYARCMKVCHACLILYDIFVAMSFAILNCCFVAVPNNKSYFKCSYSV